MTDFWGWVPNKTGAISFTQIGSQCGHDLLFEKTVTSDRGCHVVSIQNRTIPLDDSLFDLRTRFQNSVLNKEDTIFMMSAECRRRQTSSEYLTGKISCRFGNVNAKNIDNFTASTEHVFEVTFRLKRNGMCGFKNIVISDSLITFEGARKHFEEYLVSQSYMFLRDMVHRHKHHDPKSDTFLDLKTVTHNPRPLTAIKNSISYDLGKMVITQPLKDEPETIQNSLGILAYLNSFQNSVGVTTYDETHSATIKASLNAEYSKINMRLTGLRWACGVILGFMYFLSKTGPTSIGQPNEWTQFDAVFLSLTVGIILYMGQITKVYDLRKSAWSMELTRAFLYYKIPSIISILVAIGLLFLVITKIT